MSEEAIIEKLFESSLATLELGAVMVGQQLGLYGELHEGGPATSSELAARTGMDERYLREWLEQQAAAEYLDVDDAAAAHDERRYSLPEGAERVLVDPDSPSYLAPLAQCTVGALKPIDALIEAFRTGEGVPYPDYGEHTRDGIGGMNRAMFINEMGSTWLPTIPEVHARLSEPGAMVADVGCGIGWSSIAIAKAYPEATVHGYDLDDSSIAEAQRHVASEDLQHRVRHEVRDASDPALAGEYHLVTMFETLHDMARPVEALRAARRLLTDDGSVVIADERVGETFAAPADPVERFMYGWSVLHCLAVGREDEHSACTGTVMRPDTLRAYAAEAGFGEVEILDIENDFWRFYRLR